MNPAQTVRQPQTPLRDAAPLPPTADRMALTQPGTAEATLCSAEGVYISAGLAEIRTGDGGWTAVVRKLERPGHVASAYFAGGLREVVLRLDDGRTARARLTGTSFIAASERVCELVGVEPLL